MLAGKSRGGTPFCRTRKTVFPRSRIFYKVIFRCNCSGGTVARCLLIALGKQGGAVLFAPPRKAVAFLTTPSVCQKHGTGISLPAGSDQGYSPWTSPAFLKNCWIKKLFICLRLVIKNLTSRNTTWIRFGRIASLSAFVLFAGGCVVRIIFQSFLDFRFSEFFLFPEWRTAFTNFS